MLGPGGAGTADWAAHICAAQAAARRTVAKGSFLRLGKPMRDVTTLFLRLFGRVSVYINGSRLLGSTLLIGSRQAAPQGIPASYERQAREVVMPDGIARHWLYW